MCSAGKVAADAPELPLIAGAAAEISRQIRPNFIIRGIRILPQQRNGIHYKAGIAEPALVCPLIRNKADKLRRFRL